MAKVIGIDLGTTNSCVAVMEGSETVTSVVKTRLMSEYQVEGKPQNTRSYRLNED